MVIPSASAEHVIHNTGERYAWITYLFAVLLASLIGDSVILIASVKYKAIKLNKFIVVVMQHIAVCDIMAAVTYVLPTLISLIANKWVLGEVLAYIHVYLHFASVIASNILICFLVASKLLLLKFPLRSKSWTKKHAHLTCACVWMVAVLIPGLRLAFDKNGLVFSYIVYNIEYGIASEYSQVDRIIVYIWSVIAIYIPTLIVIVSTIWILVYLLKSRKAAKQSGGDKRWQGTATVVATAIVYIISIIPDVVVTTIVRFIFVKVSVENGVLLERLTETLNTLNIMCNFFIYSLTVPSFRNFLKSNISSISPRLPDCSRLFERNQENCLTDVDAIEQQQPGDIVATCEV